MTARPSPATAGLERVPEGERLMSAVAEVARIAGDAALQGFRANAQGAERKRDGSPVTEWDRGAERAAREWIERHFPNDGVLGEELGDVRPEAPRRWILDPIDGTRTFVRGVPLWGTLVAIVEGERVIAGAARFPALGEALVASPGHGCWWNDVCTAVSPVDTLGEALVLTTDERFASTPERRVGWERLAERAGLARSWGDCYGYLLVATGRAEAMLDPVMSPWDAAALQPIVEEAGGTFTDWSGSRTAFGGSVIATNARLAARVRNVVSGNPEGGERT